MQVLRTIEKVAFFLKLNALSCGNIVETTVIILNQVTLEKSRPMSFGESRLINEGQRHSNSQDQIGKTRTS